MRLDFVGFFGRALQGPDSFYMRRSMLQYIAGMVENNGTGLALRGPHDAPHHLQVQRYRFCRASQNTAGQLRVIKPFG